MKKISIRSLVLLLFTIPNILFAYSRTERFYEIIGLSDSDEIIESLKKSVLFITIGIVILFLYSKLNKTKEIKSIINIGSLGIVFIIIGSVYLIPLYSWFEYYLVNIVECVTIIGVLILISIFLYNYIKNKMT